MKIPSNVIQEDLKNNYEKNYTSIKGILWYSKKINMSETEEIKNKFNLDFSIAKLAVSRGITVKTFNDFIEPKIKNLMPDPMVLDDMEKATIKIIEFINKKIGILGDYDVDGSCSIALLYNYLNDIGGRCEYYVPDRLEEGYGPNIKALRELKQKNCELILTLDCGTTSFEPINQISKEGADVIVVDHHIESGPAPNAFAIINPKKKTDNSLLQNLCATGVVFF